MTDARHVVCQFNRHAREALHHLKALDLLFATYKTDERRPLAMDFWETMPARGEFLRSLRTLHTVSATEAWNGDFMGQTREQRKQAIIECLQGMLDEKTKTVVKE